MMAGTRTRATLALVLAFLPVLLARPGGAQAEDLDFAGDIERAPEEFVVGFYSQGDIWFHDFVAFGAFVLRDWPDAVRKMKDGDPTSMENAINTFLLMDWCFHRARGYGITADPYWAGRQQEILDEAVYRNTMDRLMAQELGDRLDAIVQEKAAEIERERLPLRSCVFRSIFFPTSDDFVRLGTGEAFTAAGEEARKAAATTLERLRGGEAWDEVARSLAGRAGSRRYGPITLGDDSEEDPSPRVVDALLRLEPGELSDVVETEHGFGVFLLEEKKPAPELPSEVLMTEARKRAGGEIYRLVKEKWIDALRNQEFLVERHPERMTETGGDPDDVILRVSLPADTYQGNLVYTYTVRCFEEWRKIAGYSELGRVLATPEGRNSFLDDIENQGIVVLWGRMTGVADGSFVRRLARMKWRADVADVAMGRMSLDALGLDTVPESLVREYFPKNLARYTVPRSARTTIAAVEIPVTPGTRAGTKGFLLNVCNMIAQAVAGRVRDGSSLGEARDAVWAGDDAPGRLWAERAGSLVESEPGVGRIMLSGPSFALLNKDTFQSHGITAPANAAGILSATPGELIGPFRIRKSTFGHTEDREGFLLVLVEEVQAEREPAFEDVEIRVREDLHREMVTRKRGELQSEFLGESGLEFDYALLLEGLEG